MTRSKYGARKTHLDGHTFDSRREAQRWAELKMLAKAGEIADLARQVPLTVWEPRWSKGRPIKYVADFVYFVNGRIVYEDVKGMATPVYRLKKKLVLDYLTAVHGVGGFEFVETK